MNIRFKRIIMNNFLCFQHEELELENLGYAIVSGINNYKIDNAKSNGSGKSSVFNAISYALTGETLQGLSNNIENVYGNKDDCWAQLILDVDGQEFSIKRIKTPKQDLKIFLDGKDISGKGIRESNLVLKNYLPDLNSTLLGSIIMLGQGLPCKFTDGHPGKRKEKLEKLTKSDYMIQLIRDKLDKRGSILRTTLREHEDLVVANRSEINVYRKQLKDINNELDALKNYNSLDISDLIKSSNENIERLKSSVEYWKKDQLQVEADIEKLSKEQIEIIKNYNKLVKSSTKEIEDSKMVLNVDMQILRKELKNSLGDVCPTCGQPIPANMRINAEEKQQQLKEKEANYKELVDKENKIREQLLTDHNKNVDKNKKILDQLNKLKATSKANETKFSNDLLAEQQNLFKLTNLKESYNKLLTNADSINAKILKLEKLVNTTQKKIIEDKERLNINTNLISLTKREFRGVLLENIIKYIDNKVKYYSKEVFGTELLSFTLNDNYIDIIYDGKYYEALSGGEQQKVDIIIQLALRDLLNTQLGINCNMLVIDEAFDFLDTVGCQKILGLITNLSNIESIFIISHHINELQISYDTEITVVKNNSGISTIDIR